MSDALARIVLVGLALAVVAGVAVLGRALERRRAGRTRLDLADVGGAVVFFTDDDCLRCDVVRSMLEATGVEFTEIPYAADPAAHRRVGVTGVPLLVVRGRDGEVAEQIAGVPTRLRLRRALTGVD